MTPDQSKRKMPDFLPLMLHQFRRHWFLLLLAAVLAVGLWWGPRFPNPLNAIQRGWLVASVMFLTALPMAFRQFSTAVQRGRSVGLALLLNMAVAPPLAWLVGRLLPVPLEVGLVIAATVPCTLASAAVWTRRGGGNDAIALCVTLITNLACFLVMPFWLKLLLDTQVSLDPVALSWRLALLVVAPIAAAQVLRLIPRVAAWATACKPQLSLAAQFGVLSMIFIGALNAGATLRAASSQAVGLAGWLGLLIAALAVHLALFAGGWWGSRAVGVDRADGLAVGIAGSQKTLMIGLDVALRFSALGFGGLVVLPMVAYHLIQLVVDTVLVDRLRVKE